jgi:hypothetical protein
LTDRHILSSFRPGEIVDAGHLQELERWQQLDFCHEPEDDFASDTPIVVVCGCDRSGTTLARVILDTHPELYAGPESLLLLPLPIDTAELARKFVLDQAALDELLATSGSRARFVDHFQRFLLGTHGKRVWVDKTARNVHRLGYIRRHFPNVRIVHVVRDPRDVVASLQTHRKRRLVDGEIRLTGYWMPANLCVDRWELAIRDALAHEAGENWHTLRYEDVVLDTERTVRELCGFLGITFDRRMLDYHLVKGPTRDYRLFPQNIEATKPLYTASVGRYRTALTAEEIELVERRCGTLMRHFGYRPADPPSRISSAVADFSGPHLGAAEAYRISNATAVDPLLVKRWTWDVLRAQHEGISISPVQADVHLNGEGANGRIVGKPRSTLCAETALAVDEGEHGRSCDTPRRYGYGATPSVANRVPIGVWRQLAITLIAMDQFAPRPTCVGVGGMGRLGCLHASLLGGFYPTIEEIAWCGASSAPLGDHLDGDLTRRYDNMQELLERTEVVVVCSDAGAHCVKADDLGRACRLIVNHSMMGCDAETIRRSDHLVIDGWERSLVAGGEFALGVNRGLFDRDRVHELATVLFGPRRVYQGRVFVNSVETDLGDVFVAGRIVRQLGCRP